jgi:hypothetical protein
MYGFQGLSLIPINELYKTSPRIWSLLFLRFYSLPPMRFYRILADLSQGDSTVWSLSLVILLGWWIGPSRANRLVLGVVCLYRVPRVCSSCFSHSSPLPPRIREDRSTPRGVTLISYLIQIHYVYSGTTLKNIAKEAWKKMDKRTNKKGKKRS